MPRSFHLFPLGDTAPYRTALATIASLALGVAYSPLAAQYAPATPLAPLPPALPRTHTPTATTSAITASDLMTRLYIFADDSMQGREAGTAGNVKGTDYIASELKRIGLQPAGENGTYFQTIPLTEHALAPNAMLRVDGTALTLGTDFTPIGSGSIAANGASVIYGGRLGDHASLGAEQVAGRLVVLALTGNDIRRDLWSILNPPSFAGALGVMVVALDSVPRAFRRYLVRPDIRFDNDAHTRRPRQNSPEHVILISDATANSLFPQPFTQLRPGTVGKAVDINYLFVDQPATYPGRNVVAILPGSDPQLREQYVALGAHNDHIGMSSRSVDHDSLRVYNHIARIAGADSRDAPPTEAQMELINTQLAQLRQTATNPPQQDSIFNGADDDGSGSMTLLEIAEYLAGMRTKPKRSMLFVWHVGEEKGLWGSEWFTDHPTVPRESIVAQLNMDMVGRGDASDIAGGGPNYLQLVGSRRLSTELGNLIEQVNRDGHYNFTLDYTFDAPGHPEQIYCRSDHYSYARYGIPVTFFTTGGHPDYHQVTDEPEYIDYTHMAHVASFVADVAVHVGNLAHPPFVDKPKPNPHGSCRQ